MLSSSLRFPRSSKVDDFHVHALWIVGLQQHIGRLEISAVQQAPITPDQRGAITLTE